MRLAPKLYHQQRHLLIIPVKVVLGMALTAFVPTFVLNEANSLPAYAELLMLGAGLVMQLCTGGHYSMQRLAHMSSAVPSFMCDSVAQLPEHLNHDMLQHMPGEPNCLANKCLTLPCCCAPAGVLIQLFWRHHILMSLCVFCAYNIIMLQPLAHVLMCTETAASMTTALYKALNNAAYTVGGLLIPYPMQRPVGAGPHVQAYIIVLWLQLQLALLLPALYLYFAESRCVAVVKLASLAECLACNARLDTGRACGHVSLPCSKQCLLPSSIE
jgi:hypothetical protein